MTALRCLCGQCKGQIIYCTQRAWALAHPTEPVHERKPVPPEQLTFELDDA